MIIKRSFLASCIIFITIASCKKDVEIQTVTSTDNPPPSDNTVNATAVENYINKAYISLLARKPDTTEFGKAKRNLLSNNVSDADRKAFVGEVQAKAGYYDNIFRTANTDLLNGMDTSEVTLFITIFTAEKEKPQNANAKEAIELEIKKLDTLRKISARLNNGTATVLELHRSMTNNYFYDQINMGSANFVISLYQHFLYRYPTDEEEKGGITMVDGQSSIAFHVNGSSKNDFASIFFSSGDYYEGQIRYLYKRHLYRNPTTSEISTLAIKYKAGASYKDIQKEILITNEYIGIK